METELRVLCDVAMTPTSIGEIMLEYHWHIAEAKNRAYLCPRKPGTMAPPDSPEQFAWGDWVGFVDSAGVVGMQCGPWPSWKEVARLELRTKRETLAAAKLILLSLKEST